MIYKRYSTALWILVAAIGIAGFLLVTAHSPAAHAGYTGPSQVGGWPTQPADGAYDPSLGGCREYSGGMAVIPDDNNAWCTYYDDTTEQFMCFYCASPNSQPNPPYIGGPTSVYTNTSTTYGIYSTDPDGDNILYYMSFGDGGAYQSPYVPSGAAEYTAHSWANPGSYLISGVAYDGSLYSSWTYLTVNVIAPPPPACVPNYSASASTCSTTYYSDGCGNWYQGTEYCPVGAPDLTTYDGASLTGTTNVPVTFSNVIQNIGTVSTGASFNNTAQVCDGGCTNLYAERYATAGPLGPGASQTVSGTYTFSTPGTYYYRFCADNWANSIAESNENNNCANYATITISNPTPPAPPSPPTCTLTSSPASISDGQSATLTWSSTNTTSTTGSGFTTGGAPSGSVTVTPSALPTSYALSCTGSGGTTNATPVTLGNSCATSGALAESITAAPARLGSAGNVTVTYSAANVQGTSCSVTGTDGYSATYPTNACAVATTGTVHAITTQTTYTITCDGVSKSVTVNLDPNFQEF